MCLLLQQEENTRLSNEELLKHPYITTDFDDQNILSQEGIDLKKELNELSSLDAF